MLWLLAAAVAAPPGASPSARCAYGDQVACGKTTPERAKSACAAGDQAACVTWGIHLESPRGGQVFDQALGLFLAACDAGVSAGCTNASLAQAQGRGTEPDLARAFALATRACDGGADDHPAACCERAAASRWGRGTPIDPEASVTWHTAACEAGATCGCIGVAARLHEGRGVDADPERALGILEDLCPTSPEACKDLAARLGPGDAERAFQLRQQACDAGQLDGCRSLAWSERKGGYAGVDPDPEKGRARLQALCDGGYDEACDDLGAAMVNDKQEPSAILEVLERACALGSSDGCARLGIRLGLEGELQDVDASTAAYERSVAMGNTWGMRRLGQRLLDDDRPRGLELLRRACDRDNDRACDVLADDLAQHDQLAEGADLLWARCELGHLASCADLGELLTQVSTRGAFHDDLRQTDPRATEALVRACDDDRAGACFNLGIRRRFGMGCEVDAEAAYAALSRSCELGRQRACLSLAWHLDHGVGVPADPDAAAARFQELCDAGVDLACVQVSVRPVLSWLHDWFGGVL